MASIPLPNGAQAALATTFAAAKDITALTNADPAVATSAAHGYSDGDVLLASVPAWQYVDNTVVRVASSDTGSFALEGVDSSSTTAFPAGATGSVQKISAWEAVTLLTNFSRSGGDAKTQTSSYLDREKDYDIITGTNPEKLDFSISYRPDSDMHKALIAANRSGEIQVMRLVLKNGDTIYYPGQLQYNASPSTTKDNEMVCMGMIALQGEITRLPA